MVPREEGHGAHGERFCGLMEFVVYLSMGLRWGQSGICPICTPWCERALPMERAFGVLCIRRRAAMMQHPSFLLHCAAAVPCQEQGHVSHEECYRSFSATVLLPILCAFWD